MATGRRSARYVAACEDDSILRYGVSLSLPAAIDSMLRRSG